MTISGSIRVATNGIISPFLMPEKYISTYLLHHSSVDGYLCFFHVLAIVNSAAVKCIYPFRSCFSLDLCPGVGLQDHMVALFLVF